MTETISRDTPLSWFEIDGWPAPHPCAVGLESRSQLALARAIIAHEIRELDRRLTPLEKRLDPNSAQYAAVQKSKQRPQLTPRVRACAAPAAAAPAQRLKDYLAPPRNPAVAVAIEEDCATWLARRFPLRGTIVAAGFSTGDKLANALEHFSFPVHHVALGEGAIVASQSRMPDLGRCSEGALAGWLSAASNGDLQAVSAYVLGTGAGCLDARLLQFVVGPHQVVVCARAAPAIETLMALWGGDVYEGEGVLIFANPGLSFADPGQTLVTPAEAAMWPKISVVTVSYNQAEFLERCLTSVLDQGYPNLEYIVIDAVSKDGSQDILRRYEPRLDKLVIEKDKGQSDGLNKGFNLATGEILTWINSDDALAPGALKRAAVAFAMSGADVVTGGCERIDEHDAVMKRHHPALPMLQKMPLGLAHQYVWQSSWEQGDYFFQPEVLFTAEIWRRSGGCLKLHLYWAMDWELWIRMALAGASVFHVPVTLGQSREHANQKTTVEELYLYQLKNILLEHDEALQVLETAAAAVPAGKPMTMRLQRISRSKVRDVASRLWGLRHPAAAKRMLRHRLGPAVMDRLERRRLTSRFKFTGIRIVPAARYAKMRQAHEALLSYEAASRSARLEFADQRQALENKARRIDDLLKASRTTAKQIADYWMQSLSGQGADEKTIDRVHGLLATRSIADIGRELAAEYSAPGDSTVVSVAQHVQVLPAFPIRDDIRSQKLTFGVAEFGMEGLPAEPGTVLAASWPCETYSAGGQPPRDIDLISVGKGVSGLEALRSAHGVLARALVCQVRLPFGGAEDRSNGFAATDTLLRQHGFVLLDIANFVHAISAANQPPSRHQGRAGPLAAADCIYVRSLSHWTALRPDQLLKLAVIMHEVYGQYGVACEALQAYDQVTGERLHEAYKRGPK